MGQNKASFLMRAGNYEQKWPHIASRSMTRGLKINKTEKKSRQAKKMQHHWYLLNKEMMLY